jgi:hypothetical protein
MDKSNKKILKQSFKIKNKEDNGDFLFSSPLLYILLGHASLFCLKYEITLVITSWIRDNDEFSKSETHQQGRAFDISTQEMWGWNEEKILLFEDYINKCCSNIGAVSALTGESRPIVRHEVKHKGKSLGDHFHLQVRRY